MKSLISRKSRLAFVTEETVRYRRVDRRIVVEVDRSGWGGTVRLEGTHARLPFSFEGVYVAAAKRVAEKLKTEKRAARNRRVER